MSGIDINRTSGVALPKELSQEIWANAVEASAVMALSRQITLPGGGVSIPVITGDSEAAWVAETDEITASQSTLTTKDLTPYKLSVIELFSNEFRRDLAAVYEELAARLPGALGKKFDATVFGSSAPGSNFDVLGGATAVKMAPHATDVKKGSYAGLVEAYSTVSGNLGNLDGWALTPQAKALLLGQVDTTGRPLIADTIAGGSGVQTLLGERVAYTTGAYAAGTPNTIGFAGDFSGAVYGIVEGIKVSMTDQASVKVGSTQINLFQRDMFAIKVEAEIGFRVRDVNRFVKLTDAARV